jgi:membrane protein implicated in regulation of membrane protease activity
MVELFKELVVGREFGAAIGILIFFGPSAVSVGVLIYGLVATDLWHLWYSIPLLAVAVILLGILGFSGWRWLNEWKA